VLRGIRLKENPRWFPPEQPPANNRSRVERDASSIHVAAEDIQFIGKRMESRYTEFLGGGIDIEWWKKQ
jgi:hypothetical protein